MKIVSVVGARPEFIQAKPVSIELRQCHQEILVHTGQHYDFQMSQAFFNELFLPDPDYNLGIGSGSQGFQTARILEEMERVLVFEKPDIVIVRGDTNSTLAGALAASKLNIPIAHIEAGERSYNRRMPEEINRLVADQLANIHFCTSQEAVSHLQDEGIHKFVYWVGDVMFDVIRQMLPTARGKSTILARLGLTPMGYSLMTIHRPGNADDAWRMARIFSALNLLVEPIIFPIHPRTRKSLKEMNITMASHIKVIDPVSYFDMIVLEENARLIATDSGGVQREAYFLKKPCLTLRDETEWTATVTSGWNLLVGADTKKIRDAWFTFQTPNDYPALFGDGHAAQQIVQILSQNHSIPVTPGNLDKAHRNAPKVLSKL
jgi:UDP-GlcNAc3NAcA epimerase